MNDLVSIILAVYNGEKYLEEALTSCFNQTYSNLEIIVINDGSTDNTYEILSGYSDRIKIISQENKGVAGAFNTGIKVMQGKWCKVMSADDVLYPECVDILVSEANRINDSKVIFYSFADCMDHSGKIFDGWNPVKLTDWDKFDQVVSMLYQNQVVHLTSLLHKNTFTNYGLYDESLKYSIDYEFFLKLSLIYGFRLHLTEKKLASIRYHENRITYKKLKDDPNSSKRIREKILLQIDKDKRKQYEKALQQYKKNLLPPLKVRIKKSLDNFIIETFPESSVKKIQTVYRTFLNI